MHFSLFPGHADPASYRSLIALLLRSLPLRERYLFFIFSTFSQHFELKQKKMQTNKNENIKITYNPMTKHNKAAFFLHKRYILKSSFRNYNGHMNNIFSSKKYAVSMGSILKYYTIRFECRATIKFISFDNTLSIL